MLALVGGSVLATQSFEHLDMFISYSASGVEICGHALEFFGHPADACAKNHTTAGQDIQCRNHLGVHHGMA